MPEQSIPYLCGGVFLTHLLKAHPSRKGVREHYMGEHDGLSDPETMLAFIQVMSPDFTAPVGGAFKESTSSYKNCRKECGTYLPFSEDSAEVRAFDECVRKDYQTALSRMVSFSDNYLEVGSTAKKDERLVKTLVEIIRDDDIADTDVFYINEDGSPSTREQLLTATKICFQSFLVGVWHYILMNRPNNLPGRDTVQNWTPTYTGLSVERVYPSMRVQCEEKTDAEPDEPIDEPFIADESRHEQTNPNGQTLNNPTVFQQFGNNGVQIGSVGTLIIGRRPTEAGDKNGR